MENKSQKNSINKLIYSLMAGMLAVVVLVSVFTVSSRRGNDGTDTTPSDTDTTVDTSGKDTSSVPTPSDTTPRDTKEPVDTKKPSDTSDKTPVDTSANPKDTDKADKPTSSGLRYFVMPTVGSVSKDFEIDVPVFSLTMNDYRAHTGVDIAASLGDEVVSSSSGTVCKIWNDPLMGKCVTIDHGDNIYTTYMNLAPELAPSIEVGTKVAMGQSLGAVGESAIIEIAEVPHLHLEMKVDGKFVDPLEYMGVASEQDLEYEG